MKLTVLGCAGSFPGPDSACSAYLVEADGFRLLLDFGTGSLSALQRYALADRRSTRSCSPTCTPTTCSTRATTWSCAGTPRTAPTRRCRSTRRPGAEQRLAAAYGEGPLDDVYIFHDLAPGTFEIGPFTVTVDRVNHPVETYGVRLEHGGRVLAYSADTAPVRRADPAGPGRRPVPLRGELPRRRGQPARPAPDRPGRRARRRPRPGVGRLVLTHLVAAWGSEANAYEAAASAFAGPVEVARAGARYDV